MPSFKNAIAIVGALSALVAPLTQRALAADMAFPRVELQPADSPQMVEFGGGWYLRGDVGATRVNVPKLDASGTLLNTASTNNAWTGGIGIGYAWNQWLRSDATLDYDQSIKRSQTNTRVDTLYGQPTIVCPTLGTYQAGPPAGYIYDTTQTCNNTASAKQTRLTAMFNGYIDLGTWASITPYVGAGVGVTGTQIVGFSNYYSNATGALYNANLTVPVGNTAQWLNAAGTAVVTPAGRPLTFSQQNWNTATRQHYYRFAWSLVGGFAYDFAPHLKLDVSYRFTNLGSYPVLTQTGAMSNKVATTQAVRVGVRWSPDI